MSKVGRVKKSKVKEVLEYMEEDREELLDEFYDALDDFKKQYNCDLDSTGYVIDFDENDGIYEEEYWVNGLIESKINELNFKVGGWFSMDVRDNDVSIYCSLVLQVNGERVGEYDVIKGWYERGRWDLEMGTM